MIRALQRSPHPFVVLTSQNNKFLTCVTRDHLFAQILTCIQNRETNALKQLEVSDFPKLRKAPSRQQSHDYSFQALWRNTIRTLHQNRVKLVKWGGYGVLCCGSIFLLIAIQFKLDHEESKKVGVKMIEQMSGVPGKIVTDALMNGGIKVHLFGSAEEKHQFAKGEWTRFGTLPYDSETYLEDSHGWSTEKVHAVSGFYGYSDGIP